MIHYFPYIPARTIHLDQLPHSLPPGSRVLRDLNSSRYEVQLPCLNDKPFVEAAIKQLPEEVKGLYEKVSEGPPNPVHLEQIEVTDIPHPVEFLIEKMFASPDVKREHPDLERRLREYISSNPDDPDKLGLLQDFFNGENNVDALHAAYLQAYKQYNVDLQFYTRVMDETEKTRVANEEKRRAYEEYLGKVKEFEDEKSRLYLLCASHFHQYIRNWGFAQLYGI